MEKDYRMDHRLTVKDDGGEPKTEQDAGPVVHEECLEECRRTCRRNFWTEVLRTIAKVAGVVLAACGLQSFGEED